MPRPSLRSLPLGLLGLLTVSLPSTAHAQSQIDCLPPLRPQPVTDAAVLAEYAKEIREEYAVYFDEVQTFFHCIEQVRAAVTEDVNQAIIDYGALEAMPPD